MDPVRTMLPEYAAEHGIAIDAAQTEKFQTYMELLLEWNQKMNLTAITEPEAVACRHFLDSLLPLEAYPFPEGASVIDVGTGAGFPGIPLKIARPDLRLTLLDSLAKRLTFLGEVCAALEIDADRIHARAEEGGRRTDLRDQFDIACARAVAPLNLLCEYCLPFVKPGGVFLSMKGPGAQEELERAGEAMRQLSAKLEDVREFTLPDGSSRTILIVRKQGRTPEKYPRHGSKIAKKPL